MRPQNSGFLGFFLVLAAKTPQDDPKTPQDTPKRVPRRPKMAPKRPPRPSQMAPRWPTWLQVGLRNGVKIEEKSILAAKRLQEASKTAQEAPKRPPRPPQVAPRWPTWLQDARPRQSPQDAKVNLSNGGVFKAGVGGGVNPSPREEGKGFETSTLR